MADIRELVILSPGILDASPESAAQKRLADLRMAARRGVVRLARTAVFRRVFGWVYEGHIALAVKVGKSFRGTRAVYLTSGLATGDRNIGISDVDIAMFGEWPDVEQFRLLKVFGALTVLLPLFDRRSLGSINTLEDVRALSATDLHMGLNFERGRREWKLLWGEPVLQQLPALEEKRFTGAAYMNLRRWWSEVANTTFGAGVVARDSIFVRTLCFKAVAEILRTERMLAGEFELSSRRTLIEREYAGSGDALLGRLLASAKAGFLDRRDDPRVATMQWVLGRAERTHAGLGERAEFERVQPVRVEGQAEERVIAKETAAHVDSLLSEARHWRGFRGAYLVPVANMLTPDGLGMLIEIATEDMPTLEQLRRMGSMHAATKLPQRLGVYLLLPRAAYLLDCASSIEFFHYTLFPEGNPEVFAALREPGYVLHGEARGGTPEAGWTPFMAELYAEELTARRGAYRRFGLTSRPDALENLRNFLRFLQLVVIEQSVAEGDAVIPVSTLATERWLCRRYPEMKSPVGQLVAAHRSTVSGAKACLEGIEGWMKEIYTSLTQESREKELVNAR